MEHTDDVFCGIDVLDEHCSHGILLRGIGVDDESFVGIGLHA